MKKVLWVDDMTTWVNGEIENLDIIVSEDVRWFVRENGENYKFYVENYDLDLIIMDYDMEPRKGDAYIHAIRENEANDSTPIVFYSQLADKDLSELVSGLVNVRVVHRSQLSDFLADWLG